MSPGVIGLVMFAALLHASWNAVLRGGADRLWSVTVMSLASAVAVLPFAVLLPLPAPASWPYLAVSSVLEVGYSVFLVLAYRHGELGQVYPIVRGSAPLLVALAGFALAGQRVAGRPLLGVLLVGLGIMSLALGKRRAATSSILAALATGLLIAGYTTSDAIGVRLAGDARAYAVWDFLLYGALMPLAYRAMRGRLAVDWRAPETVKAVAGGIVSLLAYGAVIYALALGPVGPIAALRETSVVFAAVIGRLFLGESLTAGRIAACVVVAAGAVCLGTA
jgi:drug/metabolite transporter (DMT)-like permease